ncbi:ATP-binding protein [candidate division CSSED10-310 bacterium]|uniref:histidine kinase n=1 Tax=candidate division CSSED10-310 bacterium TaxID=2855610 RepID=A0ABV6YTT4_UNCC1
MPKLVLVQGNCDKNEIHVHERLSIGRGITNDLRILDYNVSRQHALIELKDTLYLIKDLASTNGTMVNGMLIREKVLSEGDQVQIGKNILLFERDSTRIFLPKTKNNFVEMLNDKDQQDIKITSEMDTGQFKIIDVNLAQKHPTELIKTCRKLSILVEIGKTISTYTQLVPLLSKIIESIFKILPVYRGFILLTDPYSSTVQPVIMKKRGARTTKTESIPISHKVIKYVQKYKKGILTRIRWSEIDLVPEHSSDKKVMISVMCAPLFIREQVIGFIWVDSKEHKSAFSTDDLELITAIAQQTSLAIENIQLTQNIIKGEHSLAMAEMFSSIIHEIKNPLSSIQVYTELLQNTKQDEVRKEYCQVILNEINHLLDISNQILDYGQKISLHFEETDVTILIEEVVKILEQQALHKNISIKHVVEPNIPLVPLDRDKIKQVIFNIVLNALQICAPNAAINISAAILPQKKYCRISITDTGPGIGADEIEHIFQPFYSNRTDGTGLGLSISQKIVEEHQGRIQVESDEGGGATFHLELPLKRTEIKLPRW